MHVFQTIVLAFAGLGLGFGIAGNTANKRTLGWITCAVGFFALQYLRFEL